MHQTEAYKVIILIDYAIWLFMNFIENIYLVDISMGDVNI